MENNEKVAVEESERVQVEETVAEETIKTPAPKSDKPSFGAKFKEFWRKQIVKLKRKPQNIPFFFLFVCCVFYLFSLNDVSKSAAVAFQSLRWMGLCVFVNVLFSILVLVLFMNAFPRYPKVNKKTGKKSPINIPMLVLGFVFIAVMIALNVVYMIRLTSVIPRNESFFFKTVEESQRFSKYLGEEFVANPVLNNTIYKPYLVRSFDLSIAHIVLLGVTVLLYATLPLYKKLILKINTSKVIEDNDIKEVIDTEDE